MNQGLRERKKARTKTAIQRHALRLFREQGYQATTVEQIAEAAEVAPSTVFRYFPTKEDLAALTDHYSLAEAITSAIAAQPAELNPVQALRGALRMAFDSLTPEERAGRYERDLVLLTVPELWGANLGLITSGRAVLCDAMAARYPERDSQTVTDAALGVALGVLIDWGRNPEGDPLDLVDAALARLADLG